MSIAKLKTVFADGAWILQRKTFFTKINEIIDALNSLITSTTPSYTVYSAYISQTGVNPPEERSITDVASTPFQDTIGGVWSYNATGSFYYTKIGAFVDRTKVEIIISDNTYNQGSDVAVSATVFSDDIIELNVNTLSQFSAPQVKTLVDSYLYLQHIEIRVYN